MQSRTATGFVVVMGIAWLSAGGIARADDEVKVKYKADEDGYKLEVKDDSNAASPPRVIIRQRVRTVPPADAQSITSGTIVTREPGYTVRREPVRSDSLWYGDSYTDDWMYSLKEYSLRDDYRVMNKVNPSPPADVFGYVGEEEASLPPAAREDRLRRVSGVIVELRLVDVGDGGPRHVLAIIETDGALSRRVLFGPADRARDLGLVLGERVTAVGEPRVLNGTPVLFGSELDPRFERRFAPGVRQGNWYHGTILGTRVLQPIGRSERHLVATVLLDDGNTRRVDLGPVRGVPVDEIQRDDRVTLFARVQSMDGEPVLMAESLRLPDETVQILR